MEFFQNLQFYSQLLFSEFVLNEVMHYKHCSYLNKQGLHTGIKYIDAFNIKNLDLQAELNLVRPFYRY